MASFFLYLLKYLWFILYTNEYSAKYNFKTQKPAITIALANSKQWTLSNAYVKLRAYKMSLLHYSFTLPF